MLVECLHRFPRRRRLFDQDFAEVVHNGKLVRSRGVVVLLRKGSSAESRFGIIVPKRIIQHSVDRNRSKRILREWFRHNDQKLHGRDCVVRLTVSPKGRVAERALVNEIERLLAANP